MENKYIILFSSLVLLIVITIVGFNHIKSKRFLSEIEELDMEEREYLEKHVKEELSNYNLSYYELVDDRILVKVVNNNDEAININYYVDYYDKDNKVIKNNKRNIIDNVGPHSTNYDIYYVGDINSTEYNLVGYPEYLYGYSFHNDEVKYNITEEDYELKAVPIIDSDNKDLEISAAAIFYDKNNNIVDYRGFISDDDNEEILITYTPNIKYDRYEVITLSAMKKEALNNYELTWKELDRGRLLFKIVNNYDAYINVNVNISDRNDTISYRIEPLSTKYELEYLDEKMKYGDYVIDSSIDICDYCKNRDKLINYTTIEDGNSLIIAIDNISGKKKSVYFDIIYFDEKGEPIDYEYREIKFEENEKEGTIKIYNNKGYSKYEVYLNHVYDW